MPQYIIADAVTFGYWSRLFLYPAYLYENIHELYDIISVSKKQHFTNNLQEITMQQNIIYAINMLEIALTSSSYKMPIFVRFQTLEQYITLDVHSISIIEGSVVVETDGGRHHIIDMEKLTAVVAFKDAYGKPVFLKDIDEELTPLTTFNLEVEMQTKYFLKKIREWQESMLDIAMIKKGKGNYTPAMCTPLWAIMSPERIILDDIEEITEVFESLKVASLW
jgi:hypothetical protein